MRATIDAAGRVVIPKALRQRLGLKGGEVLEIEDRDGNLQITTAPAVARPASRDSALNALPDKPLPALDVETVRETLENVRR